MINRDKIEKIYPISLSVLGLDKYKKIIGKLNKNLEPKNLADMFNRYIIEGGCNIPVYLPDLARVEWAYYLVNCSKIKIPKDTDKFELNPTLNVLNLSWEFKFLSDFKRISNINNLKPGQIKNWVLIWRDPVSNDVKVENASKSQLLAIKIITEEINLEKSALIGNIGLEKIHDILFDAAEKGILICGRSRIVRPGQSASAFTLQWHITHLCDLHCKHCYDRSRRSKLTLKQGVKILDDLYGFCRDRHVRGHVCFSGGNPFMAACFFELYAAAVTRGFSISILGNPVSKEKLQRIIAIRRPEYFQVSLEGLEDHNDMIRGKGYYKRVREFLKLLAEVKIPSAVMLTLTRDNIKQVIPLAEKLKNYAGHFTFNRLSQVGEAVNLRLPDKKEYSSFLSAYVKAAEKNPILGFKDNLINIVLYKNKTRLFDGCTGFGCGAAFNFITVLPDGEAHACRKFPSFIGNVLRQGIAKVYDSKKAEYYRRGSLACRGCKLKVVCGGCFASSFAQGLDIFKEKDPYCFL